MTQNRLTLINEPFSLSLKQIPCTQKLYIYIFSGYVFFKIKSDKFQKKKNHTISNKSDKIQTGYDTVLFQGASKLFLKKFLSNICSMGGTIPGVLQILFHIVLVISLQSQFSHSIMSDSPRPHESQHTRPPCPSPTPRVHSNSCPLSQ